MKSIARRLPALVLSLLFAFLVFAVAEEKDDTAAAAKKDALAKLTSTDWFASSNALLLLANEKNPEIDTTLEKALDAAFPYPQMTACRVAAIRKKANLIPKIAKLCLTANHRAVVDAAASALVAIDLKKGYAELQTQWNGRTDRTGVNFARAVYFFKDAEVKDDLKKLVKSGKDPIAAYALEAAAHLGITDLEKEALALKPKSGELQFCINEYLGTLKGVANAERYLVNQLGERDPNTLLRAGHALGLMDNKDLAGIIPHVAKRANPAESIAALKALDGRTYFDDLKEVVKLLASKADRDRITACLILERFPDPKNAKTLQGIIRGKNNMDVKFAAMKALAAINKDDKTAIETVRGLLGGSNDEKWLGLIGLAYVGSQEDYDKIENILKSGPDQKLSAACGYALAKLHPLKGFEMLKDHLSKKQIKTSTSVAYALRFMPNVDTVDLLIPQLDNPDKKYSSVVNETLELLTGQRFPPRSADWKAWWDVAKQRVTNITPKEIKLVAKETEEPKDKKGINALPPIRFWYAPSQALFESRTDRYTIITGLTKDFGGERLMESGLMWLANFQDLDGKWSASNYRIQADEPGDISGGSGEEWDQAVTALALISFMQAGYNPQSGPYSRTIRRGLDFLVSNVAPTGEIIEKNPRIPGQLFEIAMVGNAFVEAVLAGGEQYREFAQRLVHLLCLYQGPRGGWGYTLSEFQSENSAVAIWCADTILKGQHAGLDVLPGAVDGIWNWFVNTVSDPVVDYQIKRDDKMSQEAYDKKIEQNITAGWKDRAFFAGNTAMSAYLLLQFGSDRDNPAIIGRLNAIKKYKADEWNTDAPNAQTYPHHYHLFMSRAKSIRGGDEFKTFYEDLVTFLSKYMDEKGCSYGSWKPQGFDGTVAGRIYSTALSVMALQSPYAYKVVRGTPLLYRAGDVTPGVVEEEKKPPIDETKPDKPVDETKPVEPEKQPDPAKPVEPEKQPDPAKPAEPEKPVEPEKKPDPAKPAEPEKSPKPDKSPEPDKK